MRSLVSIGALMFLFISCIQNKQIQMLQKNDVNRMDMAKDSALRSYKLKEFSYKIQPNDLINVRFESLTPKEYNFFAQEMPAQNSSNTNVSAGNALLIAELVDDEGYIPIPVVGKVKVSGMTVFQIQDTLEVIAGKYLESPIVKVRLLNYRVTILGEVNKEGTITLTNNRVSMLEAVGLAGGLGDLADRSSVKLIRQVGSKTEVQYVDLLQEDFMNSPFYYVHQNDILIVPPLKQRAYRKYFGTNLSLFLSAATLIILIINLSKN